MSVAVRAQLLDRDSEIAVSAKLNTFVIALKIPKQVQMGLEELGAMKSTSQNEDKKIAGEVASLIKTSALKSAAELQAALSRWKLISDQEFRVLEYLHRVIVRMPKNRFHEWWLSSSPGVDLI
jgi:hypothetical protein